MEKIDFEKHEKFLQNLIDSLEADVAKKENIRLVVKKL